MRCTLPFARWLALCALSCLLCASGARAAYWLVPAGAQTPSTIATTLGRARVDCDLGAVTAGLNGAFGLRELPRMVDLQTGVVRLLDAGALQGVGFEQDGELVTLAELLALPGVVVVVDVDAAQGAVLHVVSSDGRVESQPLDADQRALIGESPCAAGHAPVSFASGTRCEDIDECAAGLDDCDANASCDNTNGGYSCSCDDGYEGDGRDCDEEPSSGDEPPSGDDDDDEGQGGSDAPEGGEGGASGDGGSEPDDGGVTEDAGGRDDAAGADAGAAGAGADEGDADTSDGGCDCSVNALGPGALAHPVLLPLAWLLLRRRRPRA